MGNQVTEMSNEQAGTQAPVVVNQVDASVTDALLIVVVQTQSWETHLPQSIH